MVKGTRLIDDVLVDCRPTGVTLTKSPLANVAPELKLKIVDAESVALIAAQLQEFARDGRHSVAELMTLGRQFLGELHPP